jgi:O-antigen/teichoic acid export membrane protein
MNEINYKNLRISSAFLVGGQIFQAILAFGVNLVLVRHLSPSEFGRFALILAGTFIVYSVISPRVNILIIRMPEKDYTEKVKEIFFSAMTLETLVATLMIFLWLIVSGNAGLWEFMLVGAVGLRHWTDLNKAFYERTMPPYRKLAIVETGASAGGHLLALAMVLGGFGWTILFIREILFSLINLFGLWSIGGMTLFRLRFLTATEWLDLFKDARGVWLDGVMEGNFHRLTILLAGFFGGETIAGLFFQAQRLASVPHQMLSPIVTRILGVWFGRTEDAKARSVGRNKVLLALFFPLSLAGALTILFADPVIPWLFGESWARVADILVAMFGMVIFCTMFETLKTYCLSTHQSVTMFGGRIFQYVGLLVPIVFGFSGWFGVEIALAIGLSTAYFLSFIFICSVLYFYEKKPSND